MDNNEKDKKIEELEKKVRDTAKKRNIIIIILIIILLLLICLLGYRMGKIGYFYKETTAEPNESYVDVIRVTEGDIDITKDTKLNIFDNEKFNGQKIIAPHSKGTYQFCIKNEANNDITYNIKFADEMQHFVNMKYRLKMDNVYIKGNSDTYVNIENLNVEDIIVLKDSINMFTLEWYWEDDDEKDTYIGSKDSDEYYTLKLEINASQYVK